MAEMSSLPTLDCESLRQNNSNDALKAFGEQLVSVFASKGACYLRNHGISKDLTNKFFAVSEKFFTNSEDVKAKNEHVPGNISGWVRSEAFNHERPVDLKEAFLYNSADDLEWPNEEFEQCYKQTFGAFMILGQQLCHSLSLGLGQDKSFIWSAHKSVGTSNGLVTLRANYYPPCPDASVMKHNQLRFGEHTDFGTFAILFQDNSGGLEMEIPGKGFAAIAPMPDTLVIMPGSLLQRWTADDIKAATHRVVMPKSEEKKILPRQSVVFFLQPDKDFVIKPLNGSDKYSPITSMEYLEKRYSESGYVP